MLRAPSICALCFYEQVARRNTAGIDPRWRFLHPLCEALDGSVPQTLTLRRLRDPRSTAGCVYCAVSCLTCYLLANSTVLVGMATIDYGSTAFQEAVAAVVDSKTSNWISDINTSFLLTSGYLVFMMQLGFALVRTVATRQCAFTRVTASRAFAHIR